MSQAVTSPEPVTHASSEFALIADAAPVPMWLTKPGGVRGFVNRAYCEFIDLPYEPALAYDWRAVLHPDDVARVTAETERGLASGTTFVVEARYRRADGEWRWLRSISQPRREGEFGGYVGVAHDITEAKQASEEVRARERQLSALIDQTSAGLAQVDLSGRFTLVNDRYCEIVGRSRDALMALTMQEITHPDDLPGNVPMFEAAVHDGTAYGLEKRYVRPDGGTVWVSNSVSVIRRADGSPYGVLAVTLDITARREAEAAVRENEARLQFLDGLGKATATATDADQVLAITTRMLGEHLDASDCAYADMAADGDTFHIRGDWNAPDAPSIVGTYSLATFGSLAVADLNAGKPLIISDIADIEGDGAAAFRAIGISATICMPYIKGDRLAALMAVHAMTPRAWTDTELSLIREVTERSWAHVERVRAEAALRDSERQLRLAIAGAQIGTWDYHLHSRRGSWSPRTAEIMGVPHDPPLSERQRAALIHPDDRQRVAEGTARLAVAGDDFSVEHRIVRPDGAVRWIASHGVVMRDDAGEAVRAIGTVRDVTARREAQEALQQLNQTLEHQVADRTAERDRMWRLSRDLLLVIDTRRRIRAVNPAIEALGYAAADVVGRGLTSFLHPDDLPAASVAMRAAAQAPVGEFAARLRAGDGSWRRFAWSAAPGEGEAYVIGRDVTAEFDRRAELEAAQDALRQAQKVESLGQLTGGVAHDFNNLLTPIIGNLDLLGRRAGDDERQGRLIRGALESAERARVLVQRLLAFARRQPLQPGPVDLAELVGSMAALVASTVGPQVEVGTDIAADLPPALADANQLELAILNLAVNARDAMPDGGRLRLAAAHASGAAVARAGLSGAFVSLAVSDTGTGMDEGVAKRAIEPFFSTKGVGKGTGLGLSMVHGLASQLGGAMLLDSAPGQGTRVELLLPVSAAGPAAMVSRARDAPAGAGSVLLVDDEVPVRDAAAEMLRALGYFVTTAGSSEEALAMLDARFDHLVTDHLMPGMKGAELARVARALRPDLKVLVVSGYAALDEIPPDLPRLAKPFRLDELAASLGALT
jgi:PAS domain S-box-containing protein